MKQLKRHGMPDTRQTAAVRTSDFLGVYSAPHMQRRSIGTPSGFITRALLRVCQPIRGQVLILFVLMLGLVFLSVLAAAADVSQMHTQRRKLQNAADAAALAGAEEYKVTASTAAGDAAARASVLRNAPYATDFTVIGAGSSLQNGIQFAGDDVRVALRHEFQGFFSGAIGFPTLVVGARARATIRPPDVFLPITVKRFDEGRTDLPLDDPLQPDPAGPQTPNQRTDYLCSGTGQITAWPSAVGTAPAFMQTANCDTQPSPTNPGPEAFLIGTGVGPNKPSDPGEAIRGWVVPEIRNSHTATPTCYHDFDCSVNNSKNAVADYIESFGGASIDDSMPAPTVGESIGMIAGTSAGLSVDSIKARYQVGDTILAMVWDGTVYKGSNGNRYVFLAGYALFNITRTGANNVKVRAVSGIKPTPSEFTEQRRTVLRAWE